MSGHQQEGCPGRTHVGNQALRQTPPVHCILIVAGITYRTGLPKGLLAWLCQNGILICCSMTKRVRTSSTWSTGARPGTAGSTCLRWWHWRAALAGSHCHNMRPPPQGTLRPQQCPTLRSLSILNRLIVSHTAWSVDALHAPEQ